MTGHLVSPPALNSTQVLIAAHGTSFYIPAFQRDFAWDADNIERFFEGIVPSLARMSSTDMLTLGFEAERSKAQTFMGTVVSFVDSPHYRSVSPIVANDHPQTVNVLIDGQQRMTVSLMTALALHNQLRAARLESKQVCEGNEQLDQLLQLMEQTEAELVELLSIPTAKGNKLPYPRMIRGLMDRWSSKTTQGIYKSPISLLLSSYVKHLSNEGSHHFNPPIDATAKKQAFWKCYFDICDCLEWLANTDPSSKDSDRYSFGVLPTMDSVFKSELMQMHLFGLSGTMHIFSEMREEVEAAQNEELREKLSARLNAFTRAARLTTLAHYFLKRIVYINIVTTSENYAFSIFDSLNTTGDPLTAFETFKPEVVRTYANAEQYGASDLHVFMDEVNKYLSVERRRQDKKTKDLLVSFALAETGDKLARELGAQRSYMIGHYNALKSSEENDQHASPFVEHLMRVSRVFETYYLRKPSDDVTKFVECIRGDDQGSARLWSARDHEHVQLSREAEFCLRFLIESRHSIAIPLFSRFYAKYLDAEPDQRKALHASLCKSIRSTAAFYALWRVSRADTDNIDNHHRRIMLNQHTEMLPGLNFARSKRNTDLPARGLDTSLLANEYCRLLVTNHRRPLIEIDDDYDRTPANVVKLSRDKWVTLANDVPIYDKQAQAAKFILLLSSYWHSREGNAGRSGVFERELWFHEAHRTIDHIIPQSSDAVRSTQDKEMIDRIGNLTLLPSAVNSYLQDADWARRRIIYVALAARDEESVLSNAIQVLEMNEDRVKLLLADWKKIQQLHPDAYLPTIGKIAQFEHFGFEQITERGTDILNLAWEPLIEWLGSGEYDPSL